MAATAFYVASEAVESAQVAATIDLLREAEHNGHYFELLPKPIHPRICPAC
jgi:hypothetical protein